MAMSNAQAEAFTAFINELIETFANKVFEESQARVPQVTGELKASGSIKKTPTGMEIEYTAPYASLIDGHGEDATMISRGQQVFRFPKAPANANGFVSQAVDELAEMMLPQLIIEANMRPASQEYKFFIQ